MKQVLVLGASGAMGYAIVLELVERGIPVRAFARNREKLNQLFQNLNNVQIVPGDVFNQDDLQKAATDCDVIFHAINLPYPQWEKDLLRVMNNVLAITKQSSAKLVMVDNIHAYGRSRGEKITETTEKQPHTKKGKLRLEQIQMIEQSGVPYVLAHFPDFYGPNAEMTMLGTTLPNVMKNKPTMFVGDQRIGREHIFTLDGAKAIVSLALTEKAYGQSWNIPASETITGEEIVRLLVEIRGYEKKVVTIRKWMIQMLGIFNPFMRELVEMSYLNESPVVLDGSKYEREIGPLPRTPYQDGLRQTMNWMENNK